MKVLFVDTGIAGHHLAYLRSLTNNTSYESVAIIPQSVNELSCKQYIVELNHISNKRFSKLFSVIERIKWILEIKRIATLENPDIIHFLYGDIFYSLAGLGLNLLSKYKIVLTIHWLRNNFDSVKRLKVISKHANKIVVHSKYFTDYLIERGINNTYWIEYPCFNTEVVEKSLARDRLSIDQKVKVITCFGSQRYDKGLDIILEALNRVNKPFLLVVAGKEEAFSKDYMVNLSKNYKIPPMLMLYHVSDEQLRLLFSATDIVAVPYRRIFNGASGPLGEGVWNKKCIVGSDYGNLGDTINRYHLGYTFETENVESLSNCLEMILDKEFSIDSTYLKYREALDPKRFNQQYQKLFIEDL